MAWNKYTVVLVPSNGNSMQFKANVNFRLYRWKDWRFGEDTISKEIEYTTTRSIEGYFYCLTA